MTTITELRKSLTETMTDRTPVYAAIGATDLAVAKIRDMRVAAEKAGHDLVAELAPGHALNRSLELADVVQHRYEDLAARGERLIERLRNQQATKDFVHQVDATVAQAKGAVTTLQKGALEVERSATAFMTTGRKETARTADVVAKALVDEAKVAESEVKKSVARTRAAAKRTTTTARTSGAGSRKATKATVTKARNTGAAASKAATMAAEKVGD